MKRSQAVQKIFDLIRTTPLIDVEDDKVCAEKVMDLIEDLGMYPPDTVIEGHMCTMWDPE
jgi:hypothetical protein